MEKIFIKPDSKEIVFRGKPEDGHVDVFSYNYEDNAATNLGGLFIVGHVQPATEDTSYMVNLVASLAKREYYAKIDADPKESFSKTLKKINEVLQDFFRNKDVKVNIGIFAVAGENIFISRLGKFKIILGRDNQDVDILNNINLFNKEHIQEKEFSNVISGKIMPQDKIFAFYPARSVVAREKNIKGFFVKLTAGEFSQKLSEIKKDNDGFMCAGVHLTINKYAEPTVESRPQPRELRQEKPIATLTKVSKSSGEKPAVITKEIPNIRPIETSKTTPKEQIPSIKIEPALPPQPTPESKIDTGRSNVSYPANKSLYQELSPEQKPKSEESPLIRPSEFSSAKKDNFLSIILKKYKPSGVYIIGHQQLITKKRFILTVSMIAVIIGGAILVKLTFLPSLPIPGIESQQDKAMDALLKQVNSKLETARAYNDQNNFLEARRTLLESLSSFGSGNLQDEDLLAAKTEIIALLDQIDKAVDSSPSLLYQISQEIGNGSLLSFAENKLFVYTSNPSEANSGSVLATTESGIETTTKVSNFNPLYLIGSGQLVVMVSKLADQIGSLTIKDGGLKTSSLALSGSIINSYSYQGNLYILTSDGIYKVSDVTQGKSNAISWLTENTLLPVNPALLAVDGKIFILSESGTLAVYYKGEKESEVSTSIPVNSENVLLTTKDSTQLYLVDKKMGRIYVLNKSSGSLEKTIKLNSDQPLISASMSDSGVIYLLTNDNKVWKVVP